MNEEELRESYRLRSIRRKKAIERMYGKDFWKEIGRKGGNQTKKNVEDGKLPKTFYKDIRDIREKDGEDGEVVS